MPSLNSFEHKANSNNNSNNNQVYKAPKALASEVLAAGQLWVLIAMFT